jgi:predicted PurR-regulated permease PerM
MVAQRRILLWALGAIVALGLCVWKAPSVCTLLLASFIIAYVATPAVDLLGRVMPRSLAAALVLILTGVFFAGLALLLVPVLTVQWSRLLDRLPQAVAYVQGTFLPWVEQTFHVEIPQTGSDLAETLRTHLATIGKTIASPLGQFAAKTFGGVVGILGVVANFILTPVIAFYLTRDYHVIGPRMQSMVPPAYLPRVQALLKEIDSALGGFVRGQLIVVAILGVMTAIGLSIVGIEGAIVIGLLSGIMNLVPYVGTAIGIAPALLMALLQFSGWGPIVGVVVVFVITHSLESLLITPRIIGDKTGLSPIVVMVAILAGGEVFGFAGLLLAIPMAAILKVFLRVARDAYLQSDAYRGAIPATPATGGTAALPRQDLREPGPGRQPPARPGA